MKDRRKSTQTSGESENLRPCRADHAERALIGALLLCSKKSQDIFASLGDGRCLSSPALRFIYSVCDKLRLEGRESDLVAATDWLQNHDALEQVGGRQFLMMVVDAHVSDALVDYHLREVLRAHKGRLAQEALLEATQRLSSGDSPDQVLTEHLQKLAALSSEGQTDILKTRLTSELLDEEVEGVNWCVEGLIPSNGFAMLAGESGVGKTWLLLDLAKSVASGTPWLGHLLTTKGCVLYIDEESDIPLLQERLLKLGDLREVWELPIHWATLENLKVDTPEGLARLRATIKRIGPRLVIIDSFVRIHARDENSSQEMSLVTEALSKTARKHNCAVVVAHHARKQSHLASNDAGQRLRGSSELKAALDVHLFISKDKGGAIRIEHEKARYGKTREPLLVKLEEDDEQKIRLTCVEEFVAKVQEARRIVVEMLTGAGEPVLRRDLVAECEERGISSRTVAEALRQLKEEDVIYETKKVEPTEKGGTRTLKAFGLTKGSCNGGGPHGADSGRGGS